MFARTKHSAIATLALLTILGVPAVPQSQADTMRIEIDYMVDDDHTHRPSAAVIDAVVQMFACQGHTLIVDVDTALAHFDVMPRDPNNCGGPGSFFDYSGAVQSFGSIKTNNKGHGGTWHYCIFGHQYQDNTCSTTTSSGLAEVNGDDFVVTLGSRSGQIGTLYQQAATLAHEFGHNLGLGHCGLEYCGSDTSDPNYAGPYMPNMPSIMTYRYQMWGVRSRMLCFGFTFEEALFKEIDYARGRMCPLDEDNLVESFGTGMIGVDWNCADGISGTVAEDINGTSSGWCSTEVNRTVLNDYNEWALIVDPILFRSPEELDNCETISCITSEEMDEVEEEMMARGGCVQATLATESCITGENVYIGPLFKTAGGTCKFPFPTVFQAQNVSPDNSVYYFIPGTYDERGAVILNKPGKYFCKIGSAVIK